MTANLRVVSDALLRPSQLGDIKGLRQRCGVFDTAGQPVNEAVVRGRMGRLSLSCKPLETTAVRSGRWLYAGIGYRHFGHALIFSTARLWALAQGGPALDGILFLDRGAGRDTRPGTSTALTPILATLGVDLPIWTVATPERVETLVVPDQGLSTSDALITGTPEYRGYIRDVIATKPAAPEGATHLYISRSKMGFHKSGLMFEDRLEAYLAAAGYTIFHPQDHPLEIQIGVYKAASRIIGIDGSALHLAGFAARKDARIAIIARRPDYADALAAQARAFSGATAHPIWAYDRLYVPAHLTRQGTAWASTLCSPDFATLGTALATHGYLDQDPHWARPSPKRLTRRLARTERQAGLQFVEVAQG